MNRITIIGRVGQEPKVHTFDSGTKKASFSLATSEKYKDKDGNKVEETEWHNCVIFGKLAEVVEKYVHKGDLLALEGKVKTREYEVDGNKKYITEVICQSMEMLTPKSEKSTTEKNSDVPKSQIPATASDNEPDPFGDAPPPGIDDMPI